MAWTMYYIIDKNTKYEHLKDLKTKYNLVHCTTFIYVSNTRYNGKTNHSRINGKQEIVIPDPMVDFNFDKSPPPNSTFSTCL